MPVLSSDVLDAILAPIAGESPAGRDLRYDPRYDAVRDARREEADLPQGGLATERKIADWPRVERDTAALLTTESKDLQLAAWHAEALLRRSGLGGLASGLTVMTRLLDQYWDSLYPEIEDGDAEVRLGPLEWVGSRLDTAVRWAPVAQSGLSFFDFRESRGVPTETEARANSAKQEERNEKLAAGRIAPEIADAAIAASSKAYYKTLVADATAAIAAVDALDRSSEAHFADDPPSFRTLRTAIEEVQRFATATLAQKLDVDPDPVADVPETGTADAEPTTESVDDGRTLAAEPSSRNDAAARVASAARYLRQQDPTSPAPYLLVRGLRWGELRSADRQLDPKLLEPPTPAIRLRLRTLLLDGKWPELLEQSELAMASPAGRGWLDLQRYALTACARLGPSYDAVAQGIRSELAGLLAALPQLVEMTLMDDTPAANGETLDWLAAENLDAAGVSGSDDREDGDRTLADGSEALTAALDGEYDGDLLAAATRGSAARRSPGRRRADRTHGSDHRGDGADPFVLARAELARGRPNRALELLVAELDRERSARGRFVRQTQIAQLMVEAGMPEVAQSILAQLLTVIEEKALDTWEAGPLVAQPLALMCRVIDATDGDVSEREALYLRVCRLDPLQAISLRRIG